MVNAGLGLAVLLSVLLLPVSVPAVMSGAVAGADGPVVSMVMGSSSLGSLVLPALSMAVAVRLCRPSINGVVSVAVQVPSAATTAVPTGVAPSKIVMVLPASPVPVSVGVVSLVRSSLLLTPLSLAGARSMVGVAGAMASTVSVVDWLLVVSVAVTTVP